MGHNLTYKLNDFYRLDEGDGRYEVWVWNGFDDAFRKAARGDKRAVKKVHNWILRLAYSFPQGEDRVRPLKGKACKGMWELKPKPYRVAFMCLCDRYMLVGYIWRKRANTRDSAEIEKACKLMAELAEKFLEEVEPCS